MDRPGYAEVEVLGDRDDIHSVRVGGRAVEVMEGMFVIPDE
jgi:predicted PhzF superfamily epimerase YddE/YHI9